MRAIETRYKGYRFRSRLEARWAVFFDEMGIEWQYEMQGFELPSGRYLPDFWIETLEAWAEVKPTDRHVDERRIWEFADQEGPILALTGTPDEKWYPIYIPSFEFAELDGSMGTFPRMKEWVDFNLSLIHGRPWLSFEGPVEPSRESLFAYRTYESAVTDAVAAARGARFEFGEHGARV